MSQESPVHAGPEEKAMERSSHHGISGDVVDVSGDVVDAHVLPHVGEFRSHQMIFRTAGQLDEISHDRLKFEVAVHEMETIPYESVTFTQ